MQINTQQNQNYHLETHHIQQQTKQTETILFQQPKISIENVQNLNLDCPNDHFDVHLPTQTLIEGNQSNPKILQSDRICKKSSKNLISSVDIQKQPIALEKTQDIQINKQQNLQISMKKTADSLKSDALPCEFVVKPILQENELILVYLMHKQQKLSLFLNKNISCEQLAKKLYKEIYIFEKQTYSISNIILKNMLHKITGFESIDNDLVFDYQLKYRRGVLSKQKFFKPFIKQNENVKIPFKLICTLKKQLFQDTINSDKLYTNDKFLIRNYSDGQWAILTSIKKYNIQQDKLYAIKKSLKANYNSSTLLIKNNCHRIEQINWFETKSHLYIVSQCKIFYYLDFPETLYQHLVKIIEKKSPKLFDTIKFIIRELLVIFKAFVQCNIQIFKKLSIKDFFLNSSDGSIKVNLFNNLPNCYDIIEKKRNLVPSNNRRISQKINDKYYYYTFATLIKDIQSIITNQFTQITEIEDFLQKILTYVNQQNFTFEQISINPELFDGNFSMTLSGFKNVKQDCLLEVDFTKKLKKIAINIKESGQNIIENPIMLSEIRQQIHRFFFSQNIKRGRSEHKNMLSSLINSADLTSLQQNHGNISEFKKQQERKFSQKTRQKVYIHSILNQSNQNENFILTTKKNNLRSIQFYLQKSGADIKKKMISKIEQKYKKFFDKDSSYQKQNLTISGWKDIRESVCTEGNEVYQRTTVIRSEVKGCPPITKGHIRPLKKLKSVIIKNPPESPREDKEFGLQFFKSLSMDKHAKLDLIAGKVDKDRGQARRRKYHVYLQQADKQYSKIKELYKPAVGWDKMSKSNHRSGTNKMLSIPKSTLFPK